MRARYSCAEHVCRSSSTGDGSDGGEGADSTLSHSSGQHNDSAASQSALSPLACSPLFVPSFVLSCCPVQCTDFVSSTATCAGIDFLLIVSAFLSGGLGGMAVTVAAAAAGSGGGGVGQLRVLSECREGGVGEATRRTEEVAEGVGGGMGRTQADEMAQCTVGRNCTGIERAAAKEKQHTAAHYEQRHWRVHSATNNNMKKPFDRFVSTKQLASHTMYTAGSKKG